MSGSGSRRDKHSTHDSGIDGELNYNKATSAFPRTRVSQQKKWARVPLDFPTIPNREGRTTLTTIGIANGSSEKSEWNQQVQLTSPKPLYEKPRITNTVLVSTVLASDINSCPAGAYKTERTILAVLQAVKQFDDMSA